MCRFEVSFSRSVRICPHYMVVLTKYCNTCVYFLAGLKHALIVGAYLSLITFPSILSAPTIRSSISMSRGNSKPKWFNPCGMGGVNGAVPPEHRMPDIQLIEQIVNQAQIAEARAKMFKEEYVSIMTLIM